MAANKGRQTGGQANKQHTSCRVKATLESEPGKLSGAQVHTSNHIAPCALACVFLWPSEHNKIWLLLETIDAQTGRGGRLARIRADLIASLTPGPHKLQRLELLPAPTRLLALVLIL